MVSGFNTWKDCIEVVVWLVGAGSLVSAAYSYYLTRKQLNFAVIVSCTERFQAVITSLKSQDDIKRDEGIRKYLDLCNEELFYFKHKYLPEEIIEEWLDGMIYYFPHLLDGENVNRDKDCLLELLEEGRLHDYPRIRESFRVSREFDLSKLQDRVELIGVVKSNLKSATNHI